MMDTATRKTMTSSLSEHWCTPMTILDPLMKTFGPIGLDPCSNPKSIVGAAVEWDGSVHDGLKESWQGHGLVYVNFPYSRKCRPWTKKIAEEAAKGAEIIVLGPARTETKFFQEDIVPAANVILFWKGRLRFVDAPAPAPFPSFLAYYGPRDMEFMVGFVGRGWFHR